MAGTYNQGSVWRRTPLFDASIVVAGSDVTGHSDEIEIGGVGLVLSAVLTASVAAAGSGTTYAVVGIETKLPDGSWHLIGRWARITGNNTNVTRRLMEINALKLDSEFETPDDGVAISDDADFVQDRVMTGPVRVRYIVSRGTSSTITWNLRVDAVVSGQARIG